MTIQPDPATGDDFNLRFMHINKTAGMSVVKWFRESGYPPPCLCKSCAAATRRTGNIRHLFRCNGPKRYLGDGHKIITGFDPDLFYFTIVRNPYDRLASCFYSMNEAPHRRSGTHVAEALHIPLLEPGITLNKFVEVLGKDPHLVRDLFHKDQLHHYDVTKDQPYGGFQMTQPCSFWIKDLSRFKIFKFEEIDDISKFFRSYGFEFSKNLEDVIDEKTITKQLSSYKHLYTRDSIKIIQKHFEDDFRIFEYEE